MIHRKFDKLKFTRTYIGGSKQRELELFTEVQGTKEDNSDCNWLEYRRLFSEYSNDVLNIILSWEHISNILTIIFGILAVLISFVSGYVGVVFLILSFGFHIIYRYLKQRERRSLFEFDFSFDIILSAIKQETGFELDRN